MKNERSQRGSALAIIIVIVVVIIIGVLGFVVWRNFIDQSTSTKKVATTQATATTQKVDNYANWKSYTDSNAGYTLKFPADWKSDVSGDRPSLAIDVVGFEPATSTTVVVTVSSFKSDLTPKEFVNSNSTPQLISSNGNSINGNVAYFHEDGDGTYINRSYAISHQGKIVTVTMTVSSQTLAIDNSKYVSQFDLMAQSITF